MSALAKALLAFQKEAPTLRKASTAEVRGISKAGKPYTYEYKYSDLVEVVDAVRPLLNAQGIVFTQGVERRNGELWLTTTLMHESGDTGTFSVPMTEPADMQALGSAITYARRYCLVAALGLVADEDDDGARAMPGRFRSGADAATTTDEFADIPEGIKPEPPSETEAARLRAEQVKQLKSVMSDLKKVSPGFVWENAAKRFMQNKLSKAETSQLDAAEFQQLIAHMREQLEKEMGAHVG